jgi:membrane protease YdiL (CAAX protease family)
MAETVVVNEYSDRVNLRNFKYFFALFPCYVLVTFALYVNGGAVFEGWGAAESSQTLVYLVGVTAFGMASIPFRLKYHMDDKVTLSKQLVTFCFAFIFFFIVFFLLRATGVWFTNVGSLSRGLLLQTLVFQVLVVGTSEETIFRGCIYPMLGKVNKVLGVLVTSLIFAAFHYAAYQGSLAATGVAFVLGVIMNLLYIRFNIGASIAFHSMYNVSALGLFGALGGV